MKSLRFLALDLYRPDAESDFSSATVEAYLWCLPEVAVARVRGWMASEGWVTNRVLRHRKADPSDWLPNSEGREMAEKALAGSPQIHTRRVARERWSLGEVSTPEPVIDVSRFARDVRENGACWLQSGEGVEAITSPRGETVLPIWVASRPPITWSSDVGQLATLELASLIDNVLLEVDQQGDLVGMAYGDAVELVHPGLLRRRLLLEPDPLA